MYLTLTQKNQVSKEVALHSPLSAGPSGWREGDTRSTYRYCGTPLLLDCCRLYGCATVPVFVNVYECVDSECAISTTRRLPSTSLWLACLWRVGKEVLVLLLLSSAIVATQDSHVFCRWVVTTWPALLGWPSGPHPQPSRCDTWGCLACSAGPAQGPKPVPRGQTTWSPALSGLNGPSDSDSGPTLLPGLPCSAGLIAQ